MPNPILCHISAVTLSSFGLHGGLYVKKVYFFYPNSCIFQKKVVILHPQNVQRKLGRILCIDYGRRRCGIAVTDPLRLTAGALDTVPTHELPAWLDAYFAKEQVDTVVIGHPKQMSGEDSESMTVIRPFMALFRKRFPAIPLVEYDERFTSVLAHKAMLDGGMKKKDRQDKAVVDKIAACIILQGYLDSIQ